MIKDLCDIEDPRSWLAKQRSGSLPDPNYRRELMDRYVRKGKDYEALYDIDGRHTSFP